MYKIKGADSWNGVFLGLKFEKGETTTTDKLNAIVCKSVGFEVTPDPFAKEAPKKPSGKKDGADAPADTPPTE